MMRGLNELHIHQKRFHQCRALLDQAGLEHVTVRDLLDVCSNDYHTALLQADWLDSAHAYTILKAKLGVKGL
jgi:hypothetical protein